MATIFSIHVSTKIATITITAIVFIDVSMPPVFLYHNLLTLCLWCSITIKCLASLALFFKGLALSEGIPVQNTSQLVNTCIHVCLADVYGITDKSSTFIQ